MGRECKEGMKVGTERRRGRLFSYCFLTTPQIMKAYFVVTKERKEKVTNRQMQTVHLI